MEQTRDLPMEGLIRVGGVTWSIPDVACESALGQSRSALSVVCKTALAGLPLPRNRFAPAISILASLRRYT
jgi:hypothetical protein